MGYALPRQLPGGVLSARAWDVVDAERVALGSTITASMGDPAWETTSHNPYGTLGANIDIAIAWQQATHDTVDLSWNDGTASYVTVERPGTFLIVLQVRYAAAIPAPGYVYGGSNSGLRWARIMLNGTDPAAHTIGGCPPKTGSTIGSGTTCVALAVRPLKAGDSIWSNTKHSSSTPITSLNTTFGGTSLSVTRLGPGAEQ